MLSTKDLATSKAKVSKTIKPGNVKAKINSIALQPQKTNPDGLFLVLNLEGEDLGQEFEGFLYDSDKPQLGRAKGQVGRVRFSQYPYKDMTTKSGYFVPRDRQILRDLASLADTLGVRDQLDQIQEKDIAPFVAAAGRILANGRFLYWCIGGNCYQKDDGNKDYTLHLPKYDRNVVTLNFSANPDAVTPFKYDTHVQDDIKKTEEAAPVSGWGAEPTTTTAPAAATGGWKPSGFEM